MAVASTRQGAISHRRRFTEAAIPSPKEINNHSTIHDCGARTGSTCSAESTFLPGTIVMTNHQITVMAMLAVPNSQYPTRFSRS